MADIVRELSSDNIHSGSNNNYPVFLYCLLQEKKSLSLKAVKTIKKTAKTSLCTKHSIKEESNRV